ncbi:TPA: hypothetical protein JI312_20680, partial [Acinetobacter baumannii]|nr:hypothetical protein [Acinetobacter baumannii]HAV6219318.1 hypothetical protein [Acinetobacter baumannii]
MPVNNDKITTIDCFPNDNISRVVYRYGGLVRNEDNDSTNPFVEVLLIEIRKSDQWLFLDKCSTFLVPVLDLDAVQHGSIWDGNVLTNYTYRFSGKLITKRFSFDFSNNKPRNIKLSDKIPDTSEYYIPLKNYFLPNKVDYVLQGYPFTKYTNDSYRKVNHCLMHSNDGTQVITSSIHILHSLFVNRKDIRGLLLSTSGQSIINRFLESYTTEVENDNIEYKIKIRKPYEDIGETAIIFLANLALNPYVQTIVDKIQRSMEVTEFHHLQHGTGIRYPIVYPPHPTKLFLEAEGIWLDDNKTRFFITRVKKFDPINDHMIDVNKDLTNTVSKTDEKNPRPREKSQNKNEHINTQKPPSRTSGEYRKRSDVETGNTQNILKYSFNEPANDPIEVGTSNHPYSDKSEDVETSSDEPYGNKNTKTKKSETTDNPPSRDERFDIQYIIQSLNHLTLDTTSPLERVYSIDILGNEIHGFNLLQIKKLVPQPKHPSWIDAEFGRKLLFLKLELKDQHDQYYLIDIHKNKSHEAFCAFIIVSPHKLTREQIKNICIELENAKGIKKWTLRCESFTKKIIS